MPTNTRNTSRDGASNKAEFYFFTHFRWFWRFCQKRERLAKFFNKKMINGAISKIPRRPYPFSTMADYSSWDSLTDRTWLGRHLPPDPNFNDKLPEISKVVELFRKRDGKDILSAKSTLLFPYWVQWFTDGFLRVGRDPYKDPNRFPDDQYEHDPNIHLRTTSNHHIDLCTVYGLNKKSTDMLRSHVGGKLKSQTINGEEYPLFFYDTVIDGPGKGDVVKPEFDGLYVPTTLENRMPADRKAKLFAMGVERANVQVGYVGLNVLCLREHNRLCDEMARRHPTWDDERLFQTARNTLIVLIMRIVVEEYINHITPYHFNFIVDPPAFADAPWYRLNWMSVEFSMVYRWHSAQPDTAKYKGETIPLGNLMLNNQLLIDQGLGAMFEEASTQPAGRIGLHNTPDVLIDRLGIEHDTIAWGRKTQLASYNDYRELCQFPRVTDFNQITSDLEVQRELQGLYGHVDRLEFYVGLYAEDVRPGSALPPLIGRLVGIDAFSQAFTSPLLSEHLFNEETFSDVGWNAILTTTTLSQLIHRNIPQPDGTFKVTFDQNR